MYWIKRENNDIKRVSSIYNREWNGKYNRKWIDQSSNIYTWENTRRKKEKIVLKKKQKKYLQFCTLSDILRELWHDSNEARGCCPANE